MIKPEQVKDALKNAGFNDYDSLVEYIAKNATDPSEAPKIKLVSGDIHIVHIVC